MVKNRCHVECGADPWSADDALVGLSVRAEEPDRGSAADEGVRPNTRKECRYLEL
jgi:hypothetical protein